MKTLQRQRILEHGQQLLAIFPGASERDPIQLCKRLRRLESKANAICLRLCNGPEYPEGEVDRLLENIADAANSILRTAPDDPVVFVNRDPRGHALKIDDEDMRRLEAKGLRLHKDWGGYGIIAPEIDAN